VINTDRKNDFKSVLMFFLLTGMFLVSGSVFAKGGSMTVTTSVGSADIGDPVDVTVSFSANTATVVNAAAIVLQWDASVFALDASSSFGTPGDNDDHLTPYWNPVFGMEQNDENDKITQLWAQAPTSDNMELRLSDSDTETPFSETGQAYVNYTRANTFHQFGEVITNYEMFKVRLQVKSGVSVESSKIKARIVGSISDSPDSSVAADYTVGEATITIGGSLPSDQPPSRVIDPTPILLTVNEGGSGSFSSEMLQFTDPEGAAVTYTLTVPPNNGTLKNDGTDIAVDGTFTQADIDDSKITYQHDGGETTSDSFDVTVSDGSESSVDAMATVNVTISASLGFIATGPVTLLGNGSDTFVLEVSAGESATWTQSNADAGVLSTTSGATAIYTVVTLDAGAASVTDEIQVTDGSSTDTITMTVYSPLSSNMTSNTGMTLGGTVPAVLAVGGSGTNTCVINPVTGTDVATSDSGDSCAITASAGNLGEFTITVTDSASYHGTVSISSGNTITTSNIEVVTPITVSSANPVYISSGTSPITAEGGKGAYTFMSNDSAIATVDESGVIAKVAVGQTSISIVDSLYGNVNASVDVVVIEPLAVQDSAGAPISTVQTLVIGEQLEVFVSGGVGPLSQSVSVLAPDGSSQDNLEIVEGVFTFTALTGAGEYSIIVSDAELGESVNQTVIVNVTDDGGIAEFTLDIDGDGRYDAFTDGLLVLLSLNGIDGETLTNGRIASGATRTSEEINACLVDGKNFLDIDGNGTPDAFTDGLMILLSLNGIDGDTLTSGRTATDATRDTAAIEGVLNDLTPTP